MSHENAPSDAKPAVESVKGTAPDFPIVGIGASAGGLEALEAFFGQLPTGTGAAFVVVQHLSPDFKSLMDELLARHTDMPIHHVKDEMVVEPNAIYLIPAKKDMVLQGSKFRLTDKTPDQGLSFPWISSSDRWV